MHSINSYILEGARQFLKIQAVCFVVGIIIGGMMITFLPYSPQETIKKITPGKSPVNILMSVNKNFKLQKSIFAFLHNSISITVIISHFFLNAWQPYFNLLFNGYECSNKINKKIEKTKFFKTIMDSIENTFRKTPGVQRLLNMNLLIFFSLSVMCPISALGYFFIRLGMPVIPIILTADKVLGIDNLFLSTIHVIAYTIPHTFLEFGAFTFAGALPIALYLIIENELSKEIDEYKTCHIYKVIRETVFSRSSLYTAMTVYIALFVAAQIEYGFSMEFADFILKNGFQLFVFYTS